MGLSFGSLKVERKTVRGTEKSSLSTRLKVVATLTHYFAMQGLQEVIIPRKGQYVGMATNAENMTIMSWVWLDRNWRHSVAMAGNLTQGNPIIRGWVREVGDAQDLMERKAEHVRIEIPQPKSAEMYYKANGKIDKHNRTREACGIDKHFGRKKHVIM